MITGKGRNFQAGADINWLDAVRRSSPQENLAASRMTAEAVQRLNLLPVPTVALVQGACFGGGTGIISACDIVIAADNATFSIAEVKIGVAGTIIIPQLIDAIGLRQVRRYALTGERFDAKEAQRIGLVHEIVPLGRTGGRRRAHRRPSAGERTGSGRADQNLRAALGLERSRRGGVQRTDRKPRGQAAIGRSGGRLRRLHARNARRAGTRRKRPRFRDAKGNACCPLKSPT